MFPIIAGVLLLQGCTQVVTAPITVTKAVVETGFSMVGAAGGAIVDAVGSVEEDEESGD